MDQYLNGPTIKQTPNDPCFTTTATARLTVITQGNTYPVDEGVLLLSLHSARSVPPDGIHSAGHIYGAMLLKLLHNNVAGQQGSRAASAWAVWEGRQERVSLDLHARVNVYTSLVQYSTDNAAT